MRDRGSKSLHFGGIGVLLGRPVVLEEAIESVEGGTPRPWITLNLNIFTGGWDTTPKHSL